MLELVIIILPDPGTVYMKRLRQSWELMLPQLQVLISARTQVSNTSSLRITIVCVRNYRARVLL